MQPDVVELCQVAGRAVPEEAPKILAAGLVAHVGFTHGGKTHVIPVNYQYDPAEPDLIYLHGAHDSRMLQALAEGGQACITVTIVDGLVYSKSGRFHTNNYRSVVCYGSSRLMEDPAKKASVFEGMISRYFSGRTAGRDYAPVPTQDLEETALVAFHIDAWSAKARRGGPKGPHDTDDKVPGTSGVITFGANH
jgi:hypothetical protein